jgi:transcriptional regulator with XRE-family HTH domain
MTAPAHQPKTTIRQLRQARGWTQADVADQLGVTPWTVAAWERGQVAPWPRHQTRLADLFGVEVSEIAFGEGAQP